MTSKYVRALIRGKEHAENEKATKTRVLSNLGHELRTQINSINSVTQLILDEKESNQIPQETLSNYTDILEVCNRQMLVLVNDILDIHTIESGNFKLIPKSENLGELCLKATMPFKNKIESKQLDLIVDINPKLFGTNVLIDPIRLTQVIHNLLSNAIKYTKNGHIMFTVQIEDEASNSISILFAIKDTGIGISSSNLNKVFDSFQQIRNEENPNNSGTGLGLAISKSIIEKMDSTIQVTSDLHVGSSFSFKVRVKKSTIDSEKNIKPVLLDTALIANKTVLVTEDNRVSMLYAAKLLEKHHVKVLKAVNGIEAIKMLTEHTNIDLVLLDLEMPEMNGFTAIKHLKQLKPDLKIIAFTANIPDAQLLNKLQILDFDDFLAKPYKNNELLTLVTKYVS